jgi:DNA-binding beta-propeller fold protein YncE
VRVRVVVRGAVAGVVGAVVVGGAGCGLDPQNLPDLDYSVAAANVWADGHVVPPPKGPGETRVLVTNNLDDTVSVVDYDALLAGGDGAERARFVVGLFPIEREGPHHIAIAPGARLGYVGISNFVPLGGGGPHGTHGNGTADGRALEIDLDTLRTVRDVRVDPNPGDVRLTPDGRFLLMTHYDQAKVAAAASAGIFAGPEVDARLAIIDVATMTRAAMVDLCPAAHGIAVTSDSRTAITSCRSDEAAVVDLSTFAVRRVTLLDEPGTAANPNCDPYAVTLTADERTAYVSCYKSGELVGVDVDAAVRADTIVQGVGRAVFGDCADSGRLAFAVQDSDGVVYVDDGAVSGFVSLAPTVCELPHSTRFVDDDAVLLVVCEGNKRDPGAVIALDVASGEVLGRTTVGIFPDDLALQVTP